ncbi:putative integral membrane protein [Aspergillus niger]|uniref:Putative integral membrane protein n=1 Tax=Aspergillus niger TaxID=5061 RepID=A0A505IM36_ASPNG|nr:putative integral membrane protein [Aspergillus niger]
MATHRIATIRFVIETPVVSNIGSKLAHYAASAAVVRRRITKMCCAFIGYMSYNKARYVVAREGKLMSHGLSARDQEQTFLAP